MVDLLSNPGTIWLETTRTDERNQKSLLFAHPLRMIEAYRLEEVLPALDLIDQALAEGYFVAGYLSYEAGFAYLPGAWQSADTAPLVWFGVYDAPVEVNEGEREGEWGGDQGLSGIRFSETPSAYLHKVQRVRQHIREGDVYQINFTGAVEFEYAGSEIALYQALRDRQRVAYGAFLNTGERNILSFSPELFFRREGDYIMAQPMKGTVRRGRDAGEDERLADWLSSDEKSRAENLMIVDLLRNDLSRVCRPGSVRVPQLFSTERFETLTQMTSTIKGQLKPGITYSELFQSLFPCGSVTGAPKIRAMQLIHKLEERPRSVYCGAIGYAAPDEQAVFNVAIRTAVLENGRGSMGAGSGIVWDSDPEAEYRECLLKAKFLEYGNVGVWKYGVSEKKTSTRLHLRTSVPENRRSAVGGRRSVEASRFELIETMRWDGGTPLLELHLDRMRASARYLGFPYDENATRAGVARETAALPAGVPHKVRMTLDAAGRLSITTQVLTPSQAVVRNITVSDQRFDSRDVFLYHKTTRRAAYEAAYRQAVQAGFDEVIFRNERDEITEGSRSNIFVRTGQRLYTPPLSSGLLGGVYRRHLLQTVAEASERVLYLDDFYDADALYVCNAVWGLVEVVFPVKHEK